MQAGSRAALLTPAFASTIHDAHPPPFPPPSHPPGAAALTASYYFALGLQLGLILLAMPWAALGLSNALGRARKENINWRSLLVQRHNVNVLSAARFFLFGARDLWFEVSVCARGHVRGCSPPPPPISTPPPAPGWGSGQA